MRMSRKVDPAVGTQMVLCCAGSGCGPEPTLHGTSQAWSLTSHPAPAQETPLGTSQAVQRLRLHASNAGGMGLIPGQVTKIPHAMQCTPCPPKSQENPLASKTQFIPTYPHPPISCYSASSSCQPTAAE